MSQPAKTKAVSRKVSFNVGQYVVYPAHGLCVYAGKEELKTSVGDFQTHRFFKVGSDTNKLSIPAEKIAESGVNSLPSPRRLKEVIGILGAKAKRQSPNWKKQFESLKEQDTTGGVRSMASIMHVALSSHRPDSMPAKQIKMLPVDVNYTLKGYVENAMSFLVPVFQLRLGLTEDEATDFLYRCVLEKGFAEKQQIQVTSKTQLTDSEFQEAFGVSKIEAKASPSLALQQPIQLEAKNRSSKRRTNMAQLRAEIEAERQAAIAKRKAEQAANRNLGGDKKAGSRGHTGAGSRGSRGSTKKPIPVHMQEAYAELEDLIPTTQHVKAAFNLAARHLEDPVDLKIATRLWFAKQTHRYDVLTLCAQFNVEPAKLKGRLEVIHSKIMAAAQAEESKSIHKVKMPMPRGL